MAEKHHFEQFERDGYFVVENFLSEDDVDAVTTECAELVNKMNPTEHCTVFSGTKQSYRDDYFMKSCDNISYFYEDGALDEEGKLQVSKEKSLNKIGHALHVFCPHFRRITHGKKVKEIARNLNYKEPIIMQSMYIFKPPGIGGEVVPHQDASFLYCEKEQKVMGLWIALEDATLENGCLWFIPGSHKDGVRGGYRMVRNPEGKPTDPSCVFIGQKPDYELADFKPCEVKKGSLVAIDGLVVHRSDPNKSQKSRHIYTFHIYDEPAEWSKQNWLQPTPAETFTHLYDVQV